MRDSLVNIETSIAQEEIVIPSPLTSAQCLAIAERKMAEAKAAPRHGKELEATAQAWLVLAKRVAEAEALEEAIAGPQQGCPPGA